MMLSKRKKQLISLLLVVTPIASMADPFYTNAVAVQIYNGLSNEPCTMTLKLASDDPDQAKAKRTAFARVISKPFAYEADETFKQGNSLTRTIHSNDAEFVVLATKPGTTDNITTTINLVCVPVLKKTGDNTPTLSKTITYDNGEIQVLADNTDETDNNNSPENKNSVLKLQTYQASDNIYLFNICRSKDRTCLRQTHLVTPEQPKDN